MHIQQNRVSILIKRAGTLAVLGLLVGAGLFAVPPAFATYGDMDDWHAVGTAGISAGGATWASLVINGDTPYVVYKGDYSSGSKATVMKFNGSSWEPVGSADFTAAGVGYTKLAFDGATPYIAFADVANNSRATVMKYTGATWETVGGAGFSTSSYVDDLSFVISDGVPYVSYRDSAHGYKVTVMKYSGTAWEVVGTPGLSAGQADASSLAVIAGTPYVSYIDNANGQKATVMKFNGSSWEPVGSAGFSASWVAYTSLSSNNDTLYLAYSDGVNDGRATVMKYTGTTWEPVGSAGFSSASYIYYPSLAFNGETSYISYIVYNGGNPYVTVMKYAGSSWEPVGSARFSINEARMFSGASSLALNGNTPYLAFIDAGANDKVTVVKFGTADEGVTTATLPNTENGAAISLATPAGTNITCSAAAAEDGDHHDASYEYPLGLVDFCFTTGDTDNEVTLVFVSDLTPGEVAARKYNPATHLYADVPGAIITETTYAGHHALQLTYTITDNGELDTDPAAGAITDPVGLAVRAATTTPDDPDSGVGAPNTGLAPGSGPAFLFATIAGGALLGVLALRQLSRRLSS